MTKPNERPEWFPKKREKYNKRLPKEHQYIEFNDGFNEALDAVLKAADEHGILFVERY